MSVRHDPRSELSIRSKFHFKCEVPPVELPDRHPHCWAVATCTPSHKKTKQVSSTPAVSPYCGSQRICFLSFSLVFRA